MTTKSSSAANLGKFELGGVAVFDADSDQMSAATDAAFVLVGDDEINIEGPRAPAIAAFIVLAANSHHAMKEALEAWQALDREPFHFDDQRYLDLAAKARALTDAALSLSKEI